MTTIHIANGRVIDPSQNIDRVDDLWLHDGKILAIGGASRKEETRVIDAKGKIVCPGLIDMHVHLREPGREEDETIATGTASAVAGGVTSVACMPNTEPPIDSQEFMRMQGQRAGHANVFPIGCISKNREGKELAEIGGLVEGGAVAFTDDGSPVVNSELMRRALEYAKMFDRAILSHAEDMDLTRGGVMHEGSVSLRLGLRGMPSAAEEIMVYREIALAELTGGRMHILHVSTAGSVELIRQAKKRGARVTGEACPHHFVLTDESLRGFDSNFKMAPPLRTQRDIEAILDGLADGTLDVLATDHAPHAPEKKMREFDQTPNGIIGLETFLPICIQGLIETKRLTWPRMIEKMTINPAKVLTIDRGTLQVGRPADVTIIDPNVEWVIDPKKFYSKSRNCPFAGWTVRGRAVTVLVGGKVKYENGKVV